MNTIAYYLNRIDVYATETTNEFVGYMTTDRMVADPNTEDTDIQIWV